MAKQSSFKPSRSAESEFSRSLRKVAKISGHIVDAHVDGIKISGDMMRELENYSKVITPWATRQSAKLLEKVMRANKTAYTKNSKSIGIALRMGIAEGNVGKAAQALMLEQVELIKSIPIEAGKRAQSLALEAVYNGTRADEIAKELLATTSVTESRAKLIAVTETARASASVNQARAISVGSRQYTWRNSGDEAVRQAHKKYRGKNLDGMVFSWDDPPTLDDGTTGHPGTFPRCFPGSTELTGSAFIEKFFRYSYTGQLATLTMDDGRILTATLNHPIMTSRGFVGINSLNIGDEILSKPQKKVLVFNQDIKSFDVTFEQIFNSAMQSGVFIKTSSIGGDFHGDRTDQEVDIIRPDSSLILKIDSLITQKLFENGFTNSDVFFYRACFLDPRSNRFLHSADDSTLTRYMSSVELLISFARAHLTPLELFCFALAPHLNPSSNEMFPYDQSRDFKRFSDLIFTYSILIHGFDFLEIYLKRSTNRSNLTSNFSIYAANSQELANDIRANPNDGRNFNNSFSHLYQFNRVVDKSISNFSSHVYNLQTSTGYYIADHRFSSNCRCYAEPLFTDDER